ncbi:hypothetical protein HK102_012347, partial [Quaeritorhiza haematococci]
SLEEFYRERGNAISVQEWKSIIFGVLWTLGVLQKQYRLMHNDLHYGNILIDSFRAEPGEYFVYHQTNPQHHRQKFYLPALGVIPKLWDFEFADVYDPCLGIPRNKQAEAMETIPNEFKPFSDPHYFLTSLLELDIPPEIESFVRFVYPAHLIPESEGDSDDGDSDDRDSDDPDSDDPDSDGGDSDGDFDSDDESGFMYRDGDKLDSECYYDTDDNISNQTVLFGWRDTDNGPGSLDDSSEDGSEDGSEDRDLIGDRLNLAKLDVILPGPMDILSLPFFDEFGINPGSDSVVIDSFTM